MEEVNSKNKYESELVKIGESIFLIGSSNNFFSSLYSKLYKDLISKFPFMKAICMKNFDSFTFLFENIEYIKAEEDYDKFCEINKNNKKRRALSQFFINLMLLDIISINLMIKLINTLIKKQESHLENKSDKNIVNEISENIFILITLGQLSLKTNEKWDSIYNYSVKIANLKANAFPGLSNKTIFKFMDIIETI